MRIIISILLSCLLSGIAFASDSSTLLSPKGANTSLSVDKNKLKLNSNVTKAKIEFNNKVSTEGVIENIYASSNEKGEWYISVGIKNIGEGNYLPENKSLFIRPIFGQVLSAFPFNIPQGEIKNIIINLGSRRFSDNESGQCTLYNNNSSNRDDKSFNMPRLNDKIKMTEAYFNKTSKRYRATIQNTSPYNIEMIGTLMAKRSNSDPQWIQGSGNDRKVVKAGETATVYGTFSGYDNTFKLLWISIGVLNVESVRLSKTIVYD